MIEIRPIGDAEHGSDDLLFIDGTPIASASVSSNPSAPADIGRYRIFFKDYESSQRMMTHSLDEMPQVFSLTLLHSIDWFSHINSIEISNESWTDEEENNNKYTWTIHFSYGHFSGWVGMYSFAEFFREFAKVIKAKENSDIRFWQGGDNLPPYIERPYIVSLRPVSSDVPLSTEIFRYTKILRQLHSEAEEILSARNRYNSVAMSFDFPEEVRVPCEQYLLYFGKFLQDLGVQATSDLQHNAGQVLFTVTPADSQTALDKIRAALDVYLQLPSSPVSDSSHAEIAVQRLEANVLRVKSDLKLAVAELQAKNMTIEAQQLIIDTQKGLLSGEIMFNSMKDVTPKSEDKEELLGGILALATYKDKGVEVNLAELYRKLKRLLNDEE